MLSSVAAATRQAPRRRSASEWRTMLILTEMGARARELRDGARGAGNHACNVRGLQVQRAQGMRERASQENAGYPGVRAGWALEEASL